MFQDWMGPQFVKLVEDATGRKVKAFCSSSTHDPDVAVELFLLHPSDDFIERSQGPRS
jgi:hypothetical protein